MCLDIHGTIIVGVIAMKRQGSGGRPRHGVPPEEEFIKFNLTITKTLDERLIAYCEREERAKSWVVRKALDKFLTEQGL